MTEDARFEDGREAPLNLGALDADDLKVISSLAQDPPDSRRPGEADPPRRAGNDLKSPHLIAVQSIALTWANRRLSTAFDLNR